ncbi:hypothetical protein OIU77_000182 [Salix suchowensis]|uniref:Uncharacterized protein n=1 Tax=Salix suchowensis TaxID=1278906 RepID=A0ABQ9B584_9ROSI|nr:hypothetical protein OIU77_000182 [Salix suchowensis]
MVYDLSWLLMVFICLLFQVQKIQNLTPYNGVVYRRREEDPGSGDVKKWKSDHAFFSEKVEKEIVFHSGLLIMIQTSYNSYVVLRNESNGRQVK